MSALCSPGATSSMMISSRITAAFWLRSKETPTLATAIIVFREVLEAALIVGVVLAASRGVPDRGAWVLGGIAAGWLERWWLPAARGDRVATYGWARNCSTLRSCLPRS